MEWEHGGLQIGWNSHGRVARLAYVCHAWKDAVYAFLYNSIYLQGDIVASFVRTICARPDLGAKVRRIAVGVGQTVESGGYAQVERDALKRSLKIMDALEALPSKGIRALALRPLHVTIRPRLIRFMETTNLESFVYMGRVTALAPPFWSVGLLCLKDVYMRGSTLNDLDYTHPGDALNSRTFNTMDSSSKTFTRQFNPEQMLHISNLKLNSPVPPEILYELLRLTAHCLVTFDLDSEVIYDNSEILKSLKKATSLRKFKYLSNIPLEEDSHQETVVDTFPDSFLHPTALVDRLLPHLLNLVQLVVSSNLVSVQILRGVPPSLQHIKIVCFNSYGFTYSDHLLSDLANPRTGLPFNSNLKTWVVRDVKEQWGETRVQHFKEACQKRGIRFLWLADDEDSDCSEARFSYSEGESS